LCCWLGWVLRNGFTVSVHFTTCKLKSKLSKDELGIQDVKIPYRYPNSKK